MAATVTFGVAPLLFLQLVFGRLVYSASIVSAWFWLMIVAVVITGYYFLYGAAFAGKERGKRIRTCLTISLFCFIYVSFIYSSVFSMAERPELIKMLYAFVYLAILISFINLFTMAWVDSLVRTKEIGIRKINGAKTHEIITMLNKGFAKWVVIAFVIACPIAWYAMHTWLENFAYKTVLNWWIFALAGLIAMGITLFTVSFQSWRAATRNPVESLRYE